MRNTSPRTSGGRAEGRGAVAAGARAAARALCAPPAPQVHPDADVRPVPRTASSAGVRAPGVEAVRIRNVAGSPVGAGDQIRRGRGLHSGAAELDVARGVAVDGRRGLEPQRLLDGVPRLLAAGSVSVRTGPCGSRWRSSIVSIPPNKTTAGVGDLLQLASPTPPAASSFGSLSRARSIASCSSCRPRLRLRPALSSLTGPTIASYRPSTSSTACVSSSSCSPGRASGPASSRRLGPPRRLDHVEQPVGSPRDRLSEALAHGVEPRSGRCRTRSVTLVRGPSSESMLGPTTPGGEARVLHGERLRVAHRAQGGGRAA